MNGYIFDESIGEDMRERAAAMLFAPGEKVVVSDSAVNDFRQLLACGNHGVLTVSSVRVDGDGRAFYGFEDVEGFYPFGVFTDIRPQLHLYGAMVMHSGEPWVVEMDGNGEDPKAGRSVKVSATTGRYLPWNDGIKGMQDVATLADGGASGEFVLFQEADGSWSLAAIPWSSGLSDDEREAAQTALEGERVAPAPAMLN